MMHNATEGLKFRRFVRRLRGLLNEWAGLPVDVETIAVGLLERLWHIGIRTCQIATLGIGNRLSQSSTDRLQTPLSLRHIAISGCVQIHNHMARSLVA